MFRGRFSASATRRLFLLLAAVVVPPAVALLWLGAAFASRERDSLAQRAQERQLTAVQAAVHSLASSMAEVERRVSGGALLPGTMRLTVTSSAVVAEPDLLLWVARGPAPSATPTSVEHVEADEYRGRADRAMVAYEELADSESIETRAAALVRLARIHRVAGRWAEARGAYERMLPLKDAFVDGAPANLQARRAICDVLGELGRRDAQTACAESLGVDLAAGRWRHAADRATWEVAVADVVRWTGRDVIIDPARRTFSDIADVVAIAQSPATPALSPSSGWREVIFTGGIAPVFFDAESGRALAVLPETLAGWVLRAEQAAAGVGTVGVLDAAGVIVSGRLVPGAQTLRVAPAESDLPWTVALAVQPDASAAALSGQRQLLTMGLGAMLLLVGGSSYFLWRTVSREIEVARLQTEFVAAVSHEFRTPLTSIRHVSELLDEGDALSAEERRAFYASLSRNAQRLQRFVESLLDFARLEAGRRPYTLRALDLGAFVKQLVADFSRDLPPSSPVIRCDVDVGPLSVMADPQAFGHAVSNLIENAMKYSPDAKAVHVSVRRDGLSIHVAVTDSGIGIPKREQREIFGRFVRGRAAGRLGVHGTGLGLAIVSHVVRAHRGAVTVTSTEGAGSTFTITLPAVDVARDAVDQDAVVGSAGRA